MLLGECRLKRLAGLHKKRKSIIMFKFFNRLFDNKPKPFSKIEATYEWEGNKLRSPSGQFNLFMFEKVIEHIFSTFDSHTDFRIRPLRFAAYAYLVDHPVSYIESEGGLNFWDNDGNMLEAVLQSYVIDGLPPPDDICNPRLTIQSDNILRDGKFKSAVDWLNIYNDPGIKSNVMSVKFDADIISDEQLRLSANRFFDALRRFVVVSEELKELVLNIDDTKVDGRFVLKNSLTESGLCNILDQGSHKVLIRAIEPVCEKRKEEIQKFIANFEERKKFVIPAWKKIKLYSINKYGDYDPLPLIQAEKEYFEYEYGANGLPTVGNEYYLIQELVEFLVAAMDDQEFGFSDYPEDGHFFEVWVAEKLISLDWDAFVTSGSGDQGVDVIAAKGGVRVGIQCKQYAGTVGNSAVQQIISGKGFYEVDKGVVVSTGKYTRSARQLAEASGIGLLSHLDLEFFDDKVKDLPS